MEKYYLLEFSYDYRGIDTMYNPGEQHCPVSPELQISRTALAARSLQGPPSRALSPNGAQVCGTKLPLSGEEFYQVFIITHHFFIDITVCSSSAVCGKVIRE